MYPTYVGKKTALAADDIAGIRSVYSAGAARSADVYNSTNSTFATAANLNSQINPTTLNGPGAQSRHHRCRTGGLLHIQRAGGDHRYDERHGAVDRAEPAGTEAHSLLPATQAVLATATGSGNYGSTLTVAVPVTANTQYYVKVQGADTTAFGTGRYALGVSFDGSAPPTEASPVIAYANGLAPHSGGGTAGAKAGASAAATVTGTSLGALNFSFSVDSSSGTQSSNAASTSVAQVVVVNRKR